MTHGVSIGIEIMCLSGSLPAAAGTALSGRVTVSAPPPGPCPRGPMSVCLAYAILAIYNQPKRPGNGLIGPFLSFHVLLYLHCRVVHYYRAPRLLLGDPALETKHRLLIVPIVQQCSIDLSREVQASCWSFSVGPLLENVLEWNSRHGQVSTWTSFVCSPSAIADLLLHLASHHTRSVPFSCCPLYSWPVDNRIMALRAIFASFSPLGIKNTINSNINNSIMIYSQQIIHKLSIIQNSALIYYPIFPC